MEEVLQKMPLLWVGRRITSEHQKALEQVFPGREIKMESHEPQSSHDATNSGRLIRLSFRNVMVFERLDCSNQHIAKDHACNAAWFESLPNQPIGFVHLRQMGESVPRVVWRAELAVETAELVAAY